MIELVDLSKSFQTPDGAKVIAENITVALPGNTSIGLLGRNGVGKSTLLRMIGGKTSPDSGAIHTTGSVSWPVGFSGSFHRNLTGAQNTCFVARVYGVDTKSLLHFTEEFSELGGHFHVPVRHYSSGMRSRLAFAISIGIPFDTYLVDEVTAVGDAAFKVKSRHYFQERMKQSGAIVVTHSVSQMRLFCQAGAVLHDGKLHYFDDLEDAIAMHHDILGSQEDE
ncbi:ABC transporter ATP-binding protein [Celeribacter sp. ULVN23_4]